MQVPYKKDTKYIETLTNGTANAVTSYIQYDILVNRLHNDCQPNKDGQLR